MVNSAALTPVMLGGPATTVDALETFDQVCNTPTNKTVDCLLTPQVGSIVVVTLANNSANSGP